MNYMIDIVGLGLLVRAKCRSLRLYEAPNHIMLLTITKCGLLTLNGYWQINA